MGAQQVIQYQLRFGRFYIDPLHGLGVYYAPLVPVQQRFTTGELVSETAFFGV